MRQRPQVDLRVVRAQQRPRRVLLRDERLPHPQTQRRPHGNVLQVRIGTRQPARRRSCLVVRRVDAPGPRIHLLRQRLDVGRLQLGQFPVAQHMPDDRVMVAQILQDGRVGRVPGLRPAPGRQLEVFEQQVAELLGRVNVELVADGIVGGALLRRSVLRDLRAQRGQRAAVYGDAMRLHRGEHGNERHRARVVVLREAVALHILPQRGDEAQRRAGRRPRVSRRVRNRRVPKRNLLPPRPRDVGKRRNLQIQPVERQRLEPQSLLSSQVRRDHRVERDADRHRRKAVVGQQRERVVEVVAGERLFPEQGKQRGERLVPRQPRPFRMPQRNIPGLARLRCEREPDEIVLHRPPPRAMRLDDDRLRRPQALSERVQRAGRVHDLDADRGACGGRRLREAGPCGVRLPRRRRNARHQTAELQLAEDLQRLVAGEPAEPRRLQVPLDGRVRRDRHQSLAHNNLIRMLPNQGLDARGLHIVRPANQLLDAPELADQFHRRLLPNPRHARHIVRRVAGQRLDVALPDGLEAAVPLAHRLLVVDLRLAEARRQQNAHARRDELQRVRVPGCDQRVRALLRRPRRNRPQRVVRLVARRLDDGDAERPHHLLDALDVANQFRRHRRARRLVLLELLVPERRPRRIERDGGVRRVVVGERLEKRRREGVDAANILPGGADGQRARLLQREPSAVHHRVPVHQQQQRRFAPFAVIPA